VISPAYAQASGLFGDPSGLVQVLPFALIFVVFYFFLIRPNQQKAKQLNAMLAALRRGDRVVTGGGIIGTIAKVASNEELLVDIAEGTRVRVLRSSVTAVLAKTEPVAAKDEPGDEPEAGDAKDKRRGARGGAAAGK
jgi:preprotein translocase subunit YajC